MFFENAYCIANIQQGVGDSDLRVHGTITEMVDDDELFYIAAAPADHRISFTGSGLPFANPTQAFQHTPNQGRIVLRGNTFDIPLRYPNSYYINLGERLIPPTIYLNYKVAGERRMIDFVIAKQIPFRLLTYPNNEKYQRKSPMFYDGTHELPVRTQEQILRDSGYPRKNEMPDNFWGLKPRW
jgi:hypothetical protein